MQPVSFLLVLSAHHLGLVHRAWQRSSSEIPPEVYWRVVERLRATWQQIRCPDQLSELSRAVNQFLDSHAMFEAEVEQNDLIWSPDKMPDRGYDYWARRKLVEDAFQRVLSPRYHTLEPIADLLKLDPPVSLEQIALMYGLRTASGDPDVMAIRREIARPGSVIGPDYQHPDAEQPIEFSAEQQTLLSTRDLPGLPHSLQDLPGHELFGDDGEADDDGEQPVGPETVYDLWLFNQQSSTAISVSQAATMLRQSEMEVRRAWEFFSSGGTEQQWAEGEQAPAVPTPIAPQRTEEPEPEAEPDEPAEESAQGARPAAVHPAVDQLASLSNERLKKMARAMGVARRGRFSRQKTIEAIRAASAQ